MVEVPFSKNVASVGRSAEIVPPERTTFALLMSLVLHVILLTVVGVLWNSPPSGTGETEDRPVGIALVHRLPDRDRYVDAAEVQTDDPSESQTESSEASAPAAPPAELAPPIDLEGVLKAMKSTPIPVSGSGLAGEMSLDGDAFDTGLGPKGSGQSSETTTMLFGISGSGSRFVYVFDRSDSMNGFGGRPLRAAKAEMIQSIATLTDQQQFQIIFYNDQPTPFRLSNVPLQMLPGEDSYRVQAENYIRSISAYGGTEHEGALKMALQMAPDVIFFLTDARIPRLSNSELREIRNRADRAGTTIHAIEFGPDPVSPTDSFLRQLASQNNGQYRYVNVRSLAAPSRSAPSKSAPSTNGVSTPAEANP